MKRRTVNPFIVPDNDPDAEILADNVLSPAEALSFTG
jgi:hypothetical protein